MEQPFITKSQHIFRVCFQSHYKVLYHEIETHSISTSFLTEEGCEETGFFLVFAFILRVTARAEGIVVHMVIHYTTERALKI